ncbi:MAG TPA: hypothetical protein VGC22_02375, partial [Chitinophaga sp.]
WREAGRFRKLAAWRGVEITDQGFTMLGCGNPETHVYLAFSDIRMMRRNVRGLLVLRQKGRPGVLVPYTMTPFGEVAAQLFTGLARAAQARQEVPAIGHKQLPRWKTVALGLSALCCLGTVIWCMNLALLGALLLALFLGQRIFRNRRWGGFRNPLILALLLAWVLLAFMEGTGLLPF